MTAELTLKAEQLALFNTPVLVGGYIRKDGVTVQPHVSMRRKGEVREAPVRDLFGPIDHPVARAATPVRSHRNITTQELREAGKRAPRKPAPPAGQASMFDADGAADPAAVAPRTDEASKPQAPEKKGEKPSEKKARAPRKAKPKAAPAADAAIPQFGAREGAKPAERKRDNAKALAILASKTDEQLTPEDKAVLARYSGNGGIGDSLNEFYTRPDVATAMWGMLRKLGIEGGDVLEPSAGTGVYLHTAPEGVNVVGVELDETSSRIARVLHPAHEVNDGCLEAFARQDPRLFDGVIGNVPFGLRGAFIAQDKKNWSKAEAYFLDTALDKTRAGGIVALIVPTGVMDAQSNRSLREILLRKGEFIGAHRLPNTAFEHSHTEVTSDVVLFRRRDPAVARAMMTLSQDQLRKLGVWDDEYLSGAYFSGAGAPQVYGRMEAGWRAKAGIGDDITVIGDMHGVADALAAWEPPEPGPSPTMGDILKVLEDEPTAMVDRVRRAALTTPYEVAKPGDTKVVDGVTYVLQGRPPRWHRVGDEAGEPDNILAARDLGSEIAELARGGATDRAQLAEQIADYVKEHGNPRRDPAFMQRASGDPDLFRLLGAIRDDGSLSDLIVGRRAEGTSVEAIADKLSLDGGNFDVTLLAQQSGMEPEAVEDLLHASSRYASLPDGRWQTMGAYLTGELWPKLDNVRERLAAEGLPEHERAKLEAQAKRLDETINPRSLEDVEIMLNSAWVPTDVIAKWLDARVAEEIEKHPTSSYYRDLPPAEVTFDRGLYRIRGGFTSDSNLLEKYLNRTGVREEDMPAIEAKNTEFKRWLMTSDDRDRVEDLYNRAYTGFVKGTYSNEPMEVPGLTADPKWRINDYHWGGLRWALETGGGIIAADVGVGKTPRGLILGRLLKAYGRAKKPIFPVPKSVLAKWVKDAKNWFPDAKVLVIGESYAEGKDGTLKVKTDSAAVINRKLHELAQNDYDFVFISKPAYNRIDLSPAEKARLVGDDFWAQRAESLGQAGDKRVRAARERFEQSVAKRDFEKRSDVIYFDELGVDAIIEDEAHTNKNLFSARSRFGENPKFLGGSGQSNRAFDGYLKAKFMRERTGGKNVYDLTATPTKNSPLEIYSMLSRSAPEAFERLGIRNSEEFLDRFCVFERRMTLGINGGVEEALCTVGFKNLDELRGVMNRYIDRTTAEDVGLKLPEPDDVEHVLDMDADQAAVYADLREQAENTANKKDSTGDAHVFSIMDKMGKAALDLELLDPKGNKGYVSPKLRELTRIVAANKDDGGQIVFCEAVDTHEKIRGLLSKAGFKPEEIAIVNADEAETSLSRQRISDDFNAGKLKVVIGNKTMEEGMDLQKLTSDIHHLDIPWEPATLQQRNGRGRRQGNKKDRIRLHRYLSRGSFDGYRYQTVAAKRDWMSQLWTGGNRIDNLAMASALSREDMLVMLSADPEEARRKIAENKADAEARLSEHRKAEAAGEFVRFREMSRSLSGMKNKGTKAAARLQQQVQAARQRLEASRYFTAKDALDSPDAVVIDDSTGHVWRPGQGVEVQASESSPVNWSKGASRWVVDGVAPDFGGVRLRQYAGTAKVTVEASKLRHGVKVVPHDPEAERMQQAADQLGGLSAPFVRSYVRSLAGGQSAEVLEQIKSAASRAIQEAAKAHIEQSPEWSKSASGRAAMWGRLGDSMRQAFPSATDEHVQALTDHAEAQVMFADHGKAPEDVKNPKDLVGLPDAFIQHNLPAIAKHLRKKALAYEDNTHGPGAVVGPDGKLRIVKSYDLRKEVSEDVRHALPIEADRQRAIDAFKEFERTRKFDTFYPPSRSKRSSYSYNYQPPSAGVQVKYRGFEYSTDVHGNPAAAVMRDLFPGAEAEALRQIAEESTQAARAAGSMREVVAALAPSLRHKHGLQGVIAWQPEQLALIAERAQTLGVMDHKIGDATDPMLQRLFHHAYSTDSGQTFERFLSWMGWKPETETMLEAA